MLNHRVVLHAIDATPARWRGDAGLSPLDSVITAASPPRNDLVKNFRVQLTLVDFHTGLDAVERRTAADLLAMETVISWLKDNHDRTTASLESLARGVTP